MADALQLLTQPIYVNQTLSCVLLNMDMLAQAAAVVQFVELRPGLISEASCSLANRHKLSCGATHQSELLLQKPKSFLLVGKFKMQLPSGSWHGRGLLRL